MNAIQRKLRSRDGASITFALLLFLVCAVVSTVVIVAASATAGRMSDRAQTDQRYYAVTSAAGLLRDEFDGATAVVEYSYLDGDRTAVDPKLKTSGDASTGHAILDDASVALVRKLATGSGTGTVDKTFSLTSDLAGAAYLNCTINEYVLDGRKQLIFEISSPTVEAPAAPDAVPENKPIYTMCVTFNANVSQSESKANVVGADGSTHVRTTTTTTIGWTLAGIRKGVYTPI